MLHREKVTKLHGLLADFGRVAVAFSGGVDSSFLLKSALDVLGAGNVVIVHARSCLQKSHEQQRADTWLSRHGYSPDIEQLVIELQPLSWKEFVSNSEERCYLCKLRMYGIFFDKLDKLNIHVMLDGTNIDDLKDRRPGLRAIHELGVHTPLVSCGLGKAEIRELSRELKLDTSEQPSSSCLATRIPQDLEITAQRLELIATWENGLAELGFDGCRVRMDGKSEKIVYFQIVQNDLEQFFNSAIRHAVVRFFKNLGIEQVYLDLEGR
ncbi:MAG: ATP-dependent sacrificial sulfur transferase LarE [Thermodesulfobacteriota bacterium]|nr:ATP-dependent sacrificial sulfur transferase LarE [Thermodesulfobacteriota bacterium]